MSLPSTLQKLRMYREWIEYSRDQEYEDYDDRWQEFLDEWRMEKALNMLSESFSSEDEFDEASWAEDFVGQVYSGDADEMMYLELYANWLNQRNMDYIMRTVDDPDRSPALWNNVYGWWNSLTMQRKEEVIDEGIFVKYYNDALESYGDSLEQFEGWLDENGSDDEYPESWNEAEDFMAEDAEEYEWQDPDHKGLDSLWCFHCGEQESPSEETKERDEEEGIDTCTGCGNELTDLESMSYQEYAAESFKDWADDELRTHGKNVTFDRWVQEEYEDEPSHRHPNGQLSFIKWSKDEMNEKHHAEYIFEGTPFWSVIKIQDDGDMDSDWGVEDHDTLEDAKESYDYYIENEEGQFAIMKNDNLGGGNWTPAEENVDEDLDAEFCSECGPYSKKDAESFSAETAEGNQVFNSCWKCGSGQHLYQISRYPASPSEIAGIGMDPDQALEGWEGRRTPRTE